MVLWRTLYWKVLWGTINGVLKNHFMKVLWDTFIDSLNNYLSNGSLKNPGFKGSLWNQKWFFYGITLKNHFGFQMLLHGSVCRVFLSHMTCSRARTQTVWIPSAGVQVNWQLKECSGIFSFWHHITPRMLCRTRVTAERNIVIFILIYTCSLNSGYSKHIFFSKELWMMWHCFISVLCHHPMYTHFLFLFLFGWEEWSISFFYFQFIFINLISSTFYFLRFPHLLCNSMYSFIYFWETGWVGDFFNDRKYTNNLDDYESHQICRSMICSGQWWHLIDALLNRFIFGAWWNVTWRLSELNSV